MGFGNFNLGDAKDWITGKSAAGYSYRNAKALAEQQAALNMWLQQEQEQFNSAEAVKQRNWEKQMSDTSYQRVVKDLRKANINPMLAINNGGASTPTGSAATTGLASVGLGSAPAGSGHDPSGLLNSALSAVKLYNDLKQQKLQNDKIKSEIDLNGIEKGKRIAEIGKITAESKNAERAVRYPGHLGEAMQSAASAIKDSWSNLKGSSLLDLSTKAGSAVLEWYKKISANTAKTIDSMPSSSSESSAKKLMDMVPMMNFFGGSLR